MRNELLEASEEVRFPQRIPASKVGLYGGAHNASRLTGKRRMALGHICAQRATSNTE